MAQFVQPQNREADLNAILEGYESKIGTEHWFSDALQKDGIQNSWDARFNKKKGAGWKCSIFYRKDDRQNRSVLGIIDQGTTGLTGKIPQNQDEVVKILLSEDPNEKLSYFLSSNWSKKAQDALGSRGRGKMIFIGASEDKMMYFDSYRCTDNQYVFGKTFLDGNKAISVEILQGNEAKKECGRIFGDTLEPLTEYGTRVIIPNPKKEIIDSLLDGFMEEQIQSTWWEIFQKYEAYIELEVGGIKTIIEPPEWMPVTKLGIKETESYEEIRVPKNEELKIKRVTFCYLGDKSIPESYRGLAIQRSGMVVERYPVRKLIDEGIGDKIIGSVELDEELEVVMREMEGPEHYNIFWNRSLPQNFKNALRDKALAFAKKYRLLDEEKKEANKHQHQAEVTVQKELNDLAKSLGFSLGTQLGGQSKTKHSRNPDEKIRLSMDEFETPFQNGRVDAGQSIKGAYSIPVSELDDTLKVVIRTWVVFGDQTIKVGGKELIIEREMELPINGKVKIGWDEINIDQNFQNGKYSLRSKMIAAEDKDMGEEMKFEKAQVIYGPISRTFYVNEDPVDNGIFKFAGVAKDDKSKYYWWRFEDRNYVIYYNINHPVFKAINDDQDMLVGELMKIGPLALFSILLTDDLRNMEENKPIKLFKDKAVKDCSFNEMLQLVTEKQSLFLWDNFE